MLNIIRDTRSMGFAQAIAMPYFRAILHDLKYTKGNFSSYYAKKEKAALKSLEDLMKAYEKIEKLS